MPHPHDTLAEHVARVYHAQRSLGCEITRHDGLTVARNRQTPLIWDANFAFDVDPALAADEDAFARALDAAFADAAHQKVDSDAHSAPIVEAQLVARGFTPELVLQLVLEGPLTNVRAPRGAIAIEEAGSDEDWAALVRLQHANFAEKAERDGRPAFEIEVAHQMVHSWQMKQGMRFWLARAGDGPACAYFGSWVGEGGLGMVEYLFTEPAWRHRGIASALISRAVDAVRDEGAGAVLIGAEVEDTPKKMYLDLGFRPVCITREWLRHTSVGAG